MNVFKSFLVASVSVSLCFASQLERVANRKSRAATSSAALNPPAMAPDRFVLINEAPAAGLSFVQNNFATDKKYPFETLGGAVAMLDYDNDGALDLLFLNGSPSPDHLKSGPQSWNRLYRNTGKGAFADVTERSGLSGAGKRGYPQGVAIGDYDNDGF